MKQTNFLKEMSWTNFDERRKKTDLVIIPTGAIEVYGPHLPLGTDTLVAEKISELLSYNVSAIIGPTLEVGDSAELDEFPGTITIKPESFKNYLWDTLKSLERWGFKNFLFINTHVGNIPIIDQLIFKLQRNKEIQCAQVDYWRFIQTNCDDIVETEFAHGHASEAGTSVMLHLYPGLVDLNSMEKENPRITEDFSDIHTYIPYSSYTKSGTIGDPTFASEAKGELIVDNSIKRILDFLNKEWEIELDANKHFQTNKK